jgi:hypothetical protein
MDGGRMKYEKVEKHIYVSESGLFYFEDETSQFNGPFPDVESARNALKSYMSWLEDDG